MKRLLLGTASTAACLIVLAGVAYADPAVVINNVPGNTTVTAGTNDKATLTFNIFVTDPDGDADGLGMTCSANNGATLSQSNNKLTSGTFSLGTTTVTCNAPGQAGDDPGTTASFTVTVKDQTLSFGNVPSTINVDATSPAGATVTYTAPTAAEDGETNDVTVTCRPASGSTFPINAPQVFTTVTCTATDSEGQNSTATFLVHVEGAAEQITDLIAVVDSIPGSKQSFEDQLDNALADVNAGNISTACGDLGGFINHVGAQSGKQLTVAQANQLISAAAQIRVVLGCG